MRKGSAVGLRIQLMVGGPDERGFHLWPWGVPLAASFHLLEMSPGALEPRP